MDLQCLHRYWIWSAGLKGLILMQQASETHLALDVDTV